MAISYEMLMRLTKGVDQAAIDIDNIVGDDFMRWTKEQAQRFLELERLLSRVSVGMTRRTVTPDTLAGVTTASAITFGFLIGQHAAKDIDLRDSRLWDRQP